MFNPNAMFNLELDMPLGASFTEDAPLVEFMYLVFTRTPGGVTVGDSGLCCCVPCLSSAIISPCLGNLSKPWILGRGLYNFCMFTFSRIIRFRSADTLYVDFSKAFAQFCMNLQ